MAISATVGTVWCGVIVVAFYVLGRQPVDQSVSSGVAAVLVIPPVLTLAIDDMRRRFSGEDRAGRRLFVIRNAGPVVTSISATLAVGFWLVALGSADPAVAPASLLGAFGSMGAAGCIAIIRFRRAEEEHIAALAREIAAERS